MSKLCTFTGARGGVAIVWFRMTDLRTLDHEPLYLAHTMHDHVVHVCCFDDRTFGSRTVNFSKSLPALDIPKTGIHRANFLLESGKDLRQRLKYLHKHQDIIMRSGLPEAIIAETALSSGASAVYCHEAEAPEEDAVQVAVADALSTIAPQCTLHSVWGNTMYHLNEVPFLTSSSRGTTTVSKKAVAAATAKNTDASKKYQHFPASATQFRTSCEKSCPTIGGLLPLPVAETAAHVAGGYKLKPPPSSVTYDSAQALFPTLNDLCPSYFQNKQSQDFASTKIRPSNESEKESVVRLVDDCSCGVVVGELFDDRAVLPFQGGESSALQRVEEYLFETDSLKDYFHTRNGMVGPNYSSKFSAWLSAGCISPRYIAAEVARYEATRVKNKDTYWMLFELTFRDYFRYYVYHHGSTVFKKWGPKGKANASTTALGWSTDLNKFGLWCRGETGNPMIDANMMELNTTGFMSNRGRQIVASFLTRDMGIDWRLGAMYFESLLIDHDPCLNWGNWTYAAGVGSDPREDRYFSIPKQTANYDPEYRFIRHWLEGIRSQPDAYIKRLLNVGVKPPPREGQPFVSKADSCYTNTGPATIQGASGGSGAVLLHKKSKFNNKSKNKTNNNNNNNSGSSSSNPKGTDKY